MSRLLKRTLASVSDSIPGPSTHHLHHPIVPSPTSTLPQAVRQRRTLNPFQNSLSPLSDPTAFLGKTPKILPPKLEDEFQRLRSLDQFKGDEASARRAFLKSQLAWRSRVRGGSEGKIDFLARHQGVFGDKVSSDEGGNGEESGTLVSLQGEASGSTQIIGQKIYLPNIQIRLVRNHTPPGEAYDPTIATFRIPQSMTKTDLRSYLSAAYSLPVTFIRTANYLAPIVRTRGGQQRRKSGITNNYKKAVVGLVEPFHYPDDVDELRVMEDGERLVKDRENWLNENYRLDDATGYRQTVLMKYYKGYRWRTKTHDNSGNTVRAIMEKRKKREEKIASEVEKLRSAGSAACMDG